MAARKKNPDLIDKILEIEPDDLAKQLLKADPRYAVNLLSELASQSSISLGSRAEAAIEAIAGDPESAAVRFLGAGLEALMGKPSRARR